MIKIYLDTADLKTMLDFKDNPIVAGFTTNPSLLAKFGVKSYKAFAKKLLKVIKKPISFEVLSDDLDEIEKQARII